MSQQSVFVIVFNRTILFFQYNQVVVALQTLISFHAAERTLRALLATEGGAAVVTALLQRAHSVGLHSAQESDEDSLASHWREIFSYLASRTIDMLGTMANRVVLREQMGG